MGDRQNRGLRVKFDRRLKLKFLGSKVTTDAGLLAYRELDDALRLTEMSEEVLTAPRLGSNRQHQLGPLLRQSIYTDWALETSETGRRGPRIPNALDAGGPDVRIGTAMGLDRPQAQPNGECQLREAPPAASSNTA